MKNFFKGIIFTIVVLAGVIYLSCKMGLVPVATSSQPLPFEETLTGIALDARVEREMPKSAPIPADETNLVAGAHVFKDHCAVCHGLPGLPDSAIAKGMFPPPPQLFRGKGVTDDPPGATFWKAVNGIRLTGMPSFMGSLSANQLWQVALVLANANHLPTAAMNVLTGSVPANPPTSSTTETPAKTDTSK